MNNQIATVAAVNTAALVFCAAALQQLADSPQMMTKAILLAQIPMLLAALAGLTCIHADWLDSQRKRKNAFGPLPLNERVRHASWLATLPGNTRAAG
ncbi:MAG: hypothetical protein WA921_14375 [Ahrensia sp.]